MGRAVGGAVGMISWVGVSQLRFQRASLFDQWKSNWCCMLYKFSGLFLGGIRLTS